MITDRQKETLKIIIEEYVRTAEPVGSKSISDRLNVSSATVRNDRAALEAEGYIDKTHSSSGRVPLEKGYRYYVEELLQTDDSEFENKAYAMGSVYVALSVCCCIFGIFLGKKLAAVIG